MADETGMVQVATVIEQKNDLVTISVPISGFPEGFSLRPGDEVAVVRTESGVVAKPLVDTAVIEMRLESDRRTPQAEGYVFETATSHSEDFTNIRPDEPISILVWTIHSRNADEPRRIVATRPVQR